MLSHPLLVDAIEELFVPVAIYNNTKGDRDAKTRKRLGEPAWNNPVIRFLDARGEDLIPRKDRIWSPKAVSARLVEALEVKDKKAPAWLRLLRDEFAGESESASFAMHCYWDGEAKLGAEDGVLATEAGWIGSREVVRVRYRGGAKTLRRLERVNGARALKSSSGFRPAKASDRKFALRRSVLRYVPMTAAQRSRVNASLRTRKNPAQWLSPRGLRTWKRVAALPATARTALPLLPQLADFARVEALIARRAQSPAKASKTKESKD